MARLLHPRFKPVEHVWLALLTLAVPAVTGLGQGAQPTTLLLTNAAQIRQLTAAQAARSVPVRLRGVVITEAGPSTNRAVVIWDGTAGIYLLGQTNRFSHVARGDLVVATGATDPGEFAPIVRVQTVEKLGVAPTPPPRRVTYEELLSGGLDAQWVEISGVVRMLEKELPKDTYGRWQMDLAAGGGEVSVVSNGERPAQVTPDARVRVQAACFYQFTQQRQVLRPMLLVPAGVPVEVEQPAPANPYAAPVRPAGNLLEFSPESAAGHRVHVRGVVTHQEAGAILWIRDNSGALRIQSRQDESLRPGDDVDVLGFPKYGSYTPSLEDAVFQKRNSGPSPAPIELTSAAAAFDHQADLIALLATLTDAQALSDGWMLSFQQEGATFKALLRTPSGLREALPWKPGSVVHVTGICSVVVDDAGPVLSGIWHPQSFQLLVRGPQDLILVRPPPWWTARHIIFLLLALTGASLLVTGVIIWVTRRHLWEQAQRRAMAEAEFAAILSERNRVAREIHDTLAQGLVATSVQLRLARKSANGAPEALTRHLDSAQQLVSENLEEARKSIWDMRSQVLETSDLAGALNGILKQMADGTEIKTECHVSGRLRRLAPVLENNILRIGQEAISNAIRHSNGTRIRLELVFEEKDFRLVVKDDGRGFDPVKLPDGDGGFGLVGMRERAAHIKSALEIRTKAGQGTEIVLEVPLAGD
jgi:signal transduction histidine kinase